jgi:hypothetical protein
MAAKGTRGMGERKPVVRMKLTTGWRIWGIGTEPYLQNKGKEGYFKE